MTTLTTTGQININSVLPFPIKGTVSNIMSKDIENLSKEQLIARLQKAEARPNVDPNSYASAFLMNGHDAPMHVVKNVMHPGFQIMGLLIFFIVMSVMIALAYFQMTT